MCSPFHHGSVSGLGAVRCQPRGHPYRGKSWNKNRAQTMRSSRSEVVREAVTQHLSKPTEISEATQLAPSDRRAVLIRVQKALMPVSADQSEESICVL